MLNGDYILERLVEPSVRVRVSTTLDDDGRTESVSLFIEEKDKGTDK